MHDFIYWLIVTSSLWDTVIILPLLHPESTFVALYIILEVGLSLFALILGRIVAWISVIGARGIEGLKSLNVNNHILVIGWNQERTMNLLELLLKEQALCDTPSPIVYYFRADIINPKPGEIEFVKVDSFNKDYCMDKAAIASLVSS